MEAAPEVEGRKTGGGGGSRPEGQDLKWKTAVVAVARLSRMSQWRQWMSSIDVHGI